jgi:hypothetical protein
VYATSVNNPGYGYRMVGIGGSKGVYGDAHGGNSYGSAYGVYGTASGNAGVGNHFGVMALLLAGLKSMACTVMRAEVHCSLQRPISMAVIP